MRGIGPSLTGLGVPNALANPRLELRDNDGSLLVANNDWQDDPAQAAALTTAGLALTNALESGIATALPPGVYTAILSGQNNGTGVGLVEVYDLGAQSDRKAPFELERLDIAEESALLSIDLIQSARYLDDENKRLPEEA